MTNPLPPLPLVNGALFIDNSIMDEWNECPTQWHYRFLLNRTAAFTKPALNFGTAIHLGLAEHAKGTEIAKIFELLYTHFSKNPQPPDDHRSPGHAVETLNRYFEHYKDEPLKPLQTSEGLFVEFPFAFKLFTAFAPKQSNNANEEIPIYFCGKIDLAFEKPDHSKWVVDRKTTFQLGTQFSYEMKATPQMRGYCWAFKRAFGELPQGYIVDAIRTSVPTQKCLDDSLVTGNTKALDKWWETQFYREPFYINQEEIDEWEKNTITLIEELLWHYSRGFIPMKRKWCVNKYGRCQFYDVCTLPAVQRPLMLLSNMFIEDSWTPLNKPNANPNIIQGS